MPSCRSLSSSAPWSQKAGSSDATIEYAGPTMERTKQIRRENLNPAMSTYYRSPLLIHKGSMQWLWDHEGRRYLDMFGGIVTVSVGHCHPRVNEALEQQLKTLWHTTNIYLHPKVTTIQKGRGSRKSPVTKTFKFLAQKAVRLLILRSPGTRVR